MLNTEENLIKEFETGTKAVADKLREELKAIRGNRPSVELVEEIKVSYFEQMLPIKQLGSLSIVPPRGVRITVWDKNAVGPVMKAIETAKIGLSTSNDGQNIIATLSPMNAERREELSRLVKKTAESHRIQIRARRDDILKKIKDAESKKELTEDRAFKTKEKIQKIVDDINKQVEGLVEGKIKELGE